MTVEIDGHYEDMVEQLMIAKGIEHSWQVVEKAVSAMYATLSEEEKGRAVEGMVEDGNASGVYESDIFAEILARLPAEDMEERSHTAAREAA